jgi:hypothetical protein
VTVLVDNKYNNIQQKVPIELFFNAMDHRVYDFIEIIRNDVIETDKIFFIPIYTFDLSFETPEYIKYLKEKGRCLCGTKYCEDYDLFEGVGRNILIESLRQKCIFLKAFNGKKSKSLYFDYMNRFNKECRIMDMTVQCSDRILKEFSPSLPSEIYECSMLSFKYKGCNILFIIAFNEISEVYDNCQENMYLEEGYYHLNKLARKGLPLVSINGRFLFGKWTKNNIYEAICSSLDKKLPSCFDLTQFKPVVIPKSHMYIYVIIIVFGILLLNLIILYICKRYIKRRVYSKINSNNMEMKIDSTVKEYIGLNLQNN